MKQILILENIPETRRWLISLTIEAFPGSFAFQGTCLADVPDEVVLEKTVRPCSD